VGVTAGKVEIVVRVTDAGQSKSVDKLNSGLKQAAASSKTADASTASWGKGLGAAAKTANQAKEKFAQIAGFIPGVAAGVTAVVGIGLALVEAFKTNPIEESTTAIRAMTAQTIRARGEIEATGKSLQAAMNKAIERQRALLILQGDQAGADRLALQLSVAAAREDRIDAAVALAQAQASTILPTIEASASKRQLAEIQRNTQTAYANAKTVLGELAQRVIPGVAKQIEALPAQLIAAEARAVQAASALDEARVNVERAEGVIARLNATRIMEHVAEAAKQTAYVAQSGAAALRTTQGAASAIVGMLEASKAPRLAIVEAIGHEFGLRKQIAQMDIDASDRALSAEQERLMVIKRQLQLRYDKRGDAGTAKDLDQVGLSYRRLQAARDDLYRQGKVLAATEPGKPKGDKAPSVDTPKWGGLALPYGDTVSRSAGGQTATAAGVMVLDPSVGAVFSRFLSGSTALTRQIEALERSSAAERSRIITDFDRRISAAQSARDVAAQRYAYANTQRSEAKTPEAAAAYGGEADKQGAAARAAGQAVVDAEREKQAALTALAEGGAVARGEVARSEVAEQMAAYGQIGAGMQAALAEIQGVGTAAQDFFSATVGLAKGVADHWADIEAGKSGVIAAITAQAAAGMKSKKAEYALNALGYAAEAAASFVEQNYAQGVGYLVVAGMFAAAAGSSGGSKGRAPARRPSARPSGLGQGGAVIINLNAPLLSNQESAAWMLNTMRSAAGTGFGAG